MGKKNCSMLSLFNYDKVRCIVFIVIFCFVCIKIAAQSVDEINRWINSNNSLSADLRELKKHCSSYLVIDDTIYTSSDYVLLGIHEYCFWPIYWKIGRYVIENDSIKYIGSIYFDYKDYHARWINKFKFRIKDGYVYWRKRFSFSKKIRGKFPCSMIDERGRKLDLRVVMQQFQE